jgi:hypothetical protein
MAREYLNINSVHDRIRFFLSLLILQGTLNGRKGPEPATWCNLEFLSRLERFPFVE